MIPDRLKEIRKINDDTQPDLAAKLNVSLPTVQSWEQGKSSPSHEMLIGICRLYNVSSDYLLGLSDEYQPNKSNFAYRLTEEELLEVQEYEAFLIWQRGKKKGK